MGSAGWVWAVADVKTRAVSAALEERTRRRWIHRCFVAIGALGAVVVVVVAGLARLLDGDMVVLLSFIASTVSAFKFENSLLLVPFLCAC